MRKPVAQPPGGRPGLPVVFVHVKHESLCGPVGSKYGNPSVGWVVAETSRYGSVSPVFKNSRLAKKWAEDRYLIGGWTEPSGGPYHQMYAIPAEG